VLLPPPGRAGKLGRLRSLAMKAILLLPFAWTLNAGESPKVAGEPPKVAQVETAKEPLNDLILFTRKYNHVEPFQPGPYDSNVVQLTSRVLQRWHYSRHPLDNEIADHFLHRYLQILDGLHFHFLQADIHEFDRYRASLDDLTMQAGDSSPANVIFARFLQRVEQRVEYVAELLKEGKFDFTGDDRYAPNRHESPWPKDMAEAKEIWRQQFRYEYLQEKLNKQKPEEIIKTLSNRYRRLLRTLGEFDSDDVLQLYLTALSQAYDPHSDYMGKAQLENFAIQMKLSLFGIGALLRSEDGYCKIHELLAGGPAAASKKLKPNDKIIAVQQPGKEPVDVVDMKLNKVVEMIRGPKGTEVILTVIPADAADPSARKLVTLVRDEIKLEDQEAKARIVEMPDSNSNVTRLGVIDLPSFYASFDLANARGKSAPKSTTVDVTRLLKKLMEENVKGVILDLRRNGGGSLEEAIRLTGIFIKEGPVVQVKDSEGHMEKELDPDPSVVYDGPLVVLTSRFSASASEILAAALQDYGRALLVGDSTTHGKGTVQTIFELSKFTRQRFPTNFNPGALKVTIRKFYRANGASTQLRGVTPDVVLPSINDYMDVGESAQEYAMEWDTIPSAEFDRLDRIQPVLDELRKRTIARQADEKDFAYLREDIEQYRKLKADKSISLNEAQRLKEKADAEAKAKVRKQERAARGESKAKNYEITLKQVDVPGLPAPMTVTNELPAKVEGQAETASADGSAAESEDKTPAVDVTLEETKRILQDLIALSATTPKPAVAVKN